ncbi:hypothetical protein [Leekyejoonella antrihumi]|uniref:LemA family protein n=1 Tax=Leekyejoonella antrihumi TaxID=1660198 RepID=A0A563E456_9MICO|nr:hypothetical protein [Leekyejoonella antrihumi]TWP36654.1 hypothetical protein FGL98_09365 [Leekyejoonella antrihumi]
MHRWDWIVVAVAVIALVAWYLSYNAARLDRLHARVEGSLASLDAQIVRRAEVSLELANAQLLDPASSMLLAEAATTSLDTSDAAAVQSEVQEHGVDARRARVETELTHTLRATLTPSVIASVVAERGDARDELVRLREAGERVQLSRRFHNDAVHDVRRVRAKPVARLFRLAGHTSLPHLVEFEDEVPVDV